MQVFERSPVPFYTIDRTFRILSCSASALDMFAEADSFLELIAEESLNDANALLLPKEKPFSVDLHMTTRRNAVTAFQVFVEWSGAEPDRANVVCIERQIRAKGGRGRAGAGGRTAASEARQEFDVLRAIAELSAKVDMIGDIAAGFAHEIRNPLTTVRGFVQLLRPSLAEIGKEQYADIVLSEINRANDILNQFMNSSRPPAPQRKPVEAETLIKQAMSELEEEAAAAGCTVSFQPAGPLSIYVDVPQVRQALINLIRNGIDAVQRGGAGGAVEIEALRAEGGVQIRVRDTGIGMDPKTLSRLFVPFFTTKDGALGLGLTACRRIVENHGGTLLVESLPGKGSTFVIQFTHQKLQEE